MWVTRKFYLVIASLTMTGCLLFTEGRPYPSKGTGAMSKVVAIMSMSLDGQEEP